MWKIPESKTGDPGASPDWLGGLLATLGFGGIVFALIQSALIAGIVGAVALIGLSYQQAHSASPMVPFRLFGSRNFAGANLLTLFLYAALGGALVFFPLDLIQVQGYSPRKREPLCCLSFWRCSCCRAGLAGFWIGTARRRRSSSAR